MTNNKILPVALVATLLGGTVGAFVMHENRSAANDTAQTATAQPQTTNTVATDKTATPNDQVAANDQNAALDDEIAAETRGMTEEQRAAFRDGFLEGAQSAQVSTTRNTRTVVVPNERVVYRTRTRYARSAPRRVYYDYGQRSGRTFWQKHRDKLTTAIGAGGGALLGGIIGGGKGAAIGALAGGGGSALWTYKLRKHHRY
ncbi:MAG TPA: hypothetical protein VFA21_03590 [Pyrinomonadaceae bacterium]|nr:hypothetical protein [Pyrinomonadaceae bacterium]